MRAAGRPGRAARTGAGRCRGRRPKRPTRGRREPSGARAPAAWPPGRRRGPPPGAAARAARWLWPAGVSLGVQALELRGVLVGDDGALHLQRRRQLAGLLREVVVEDEEPLDLLHARVPAVDLVEHALDELAHLRLTHERSGLLGQAMLARELHDLLGVERDQRHRVGPAVAVHERLRDPARLLEVVLEVRGREVLATGRDDDVLLATGDRQVAVG